MDRSRRRWWPWVLLCVGVGLVVLFLYWPGSDRVGGQYVYQTAPVEQGTLAVHVTAVGSLEPSNAVAVGTELSGIVSKVYVDANDRVEEGQVLAELDTELLRAQSRQSRAGVDAAEASLANAMATAEGAASSLARVQQLAASGTVSTAELERAQTSHRQAVAGVALTEAQLEQARASHGAALTSLDRTKIASPITGVVLERSVEVGQAVISSLQAATLFRVAEDLHTMTVDVEIDEADIGRVEKGQAADFTVAAYTDRVFDAEVVKVNLAPADNSEVVSYIATLSLENPDLKLLPGMTATASITAETFENALLVPNGALRYEPIDSTLPRPEPRDGRRVARVWVLSGEEPVPVEVLPRATDGRRTVVEGNVHPGQELVLSAQKARRRKPEGE